MGADHQTVRYAITDLAGLPFQDGTTPSGLRLRHWLADLHRWSAQDIDFIQLREKTLSAGELFALSQTAVSVLGQIAATHGKPPPRLLVNGRADVAAAARAGGVHLTGRPGELLPDQVRTAFNKAGLPDCAVSITCHTAGEVVAARKDGADLILFGPVFEKRTAGDVVVQGSGLTLLREACLAAHTVRVLALGGVTQANTASCLDAGASGVAGIRLFS